MPIQILPPQLANQIAAGEVVERPASVVKELVENSLDAGATQIHIEIEQGGSGLIRVRDNGMGIAKEELALSLARHATSKISSLDDLEAILSLGFRGEALASISSVSRLTLTSRTAEQREAWQVYAQGREMETVIKPAAHPVGTTVDVANLFFNTPARRKFLRSDKTEFMHIDEVIRRIALAKPNITFTLVHNGKTVRQYRTAASYEQKLKRLAAICGDNFVQNAFHIDWKHGDLHLSGWIAAPNTAATQTEIHYSYVNGRMVRDKVITHAIKQAYQDSYSNGVQPAFVLFIDLNPSDVDVNVHPTKHEVRFQQARLIHDFICQGIINALAQTKNDIATQEIPKIQEPNAGYTPNRASAGRNHFVDYREPSEKRAHFVPHFSTSSSSPPKALQQLTQQLYSSHRTDENNVIERHSAISTDSVGVHQSEQLLRALALVEKRALLLQQQQHFFLLPILSLQTLATELALSHTPVAQQALLIPQRFRLNQEQYLIWQQQQDFFQKIGFQWQQNAQQQINITHVPQILRQQNIQHILISLLSHTVTDFSEFMAELLKLLDFSPIEIFADAVNLLTETEQRASAKQLSAYFIPVDFSTYL